ncbi:glyoxalase [Halothiobacillus diazotrophicus]|uniref:Glyoxalase n=1 Tax=Halothiobacillus diazotrophicus TaxID=1860122 RepID=A0A191ZHC0_9GAMM|nr:VOC family protein [Halothiobacillus diazotrophicus]ANJ67247.1 glyoxalase [Halothiobacillus diazotrophicus]
MDEVRNGAILGVDHVSVVVSDAQASAAFYRQVLGLADADRPDLGFPGAWLRLSGTITLHLLELPNPDPATGRPEHGGRDRHVALRVADTAPFIARLDALSWPYTRSKSGRDAVFFRDPDGNALELVGLAA